MALKKLSFIDLLKAVIIRVESGTGKRCYDAVPDNTKSPFYFAEIVGRDPKDTKMMFMDVFTVFVHVVAEPSRSSVGVYDLIQSLEEALTVDIVLPAGYRLWKQVDTGLQKTIDSETDEKHAIEGYEFHVCYGYRVK